MKLVLSILLFFNTLLSHAQYKDDYIKTVLRKNNDRFIGDKFGSFSGRSIDGRPYSNKNFQNKITFVSFWFSACVPCVNEFEELKKLYSTYSTSKSFQFLSFTFDSEKEAAKTKLAYNLPYIIINLPDPFCSELGLRRGYPTNMIIDQSGKIVKLFTGSDAYSEKEYFSNRIYPLIDSMLVKLNN